MIAEVRFKFKTAFFQYKRKKARWITVFERIKGIIQPLIVVEDGYLSR